MMLKVQATRIHLTFLCHSGIYRNHNIPGLPDIICEKLKNVPTIFDASLTVTNNL